MTDFWKTVLRLKPDLSAVYFAPTKDSILKCLAYEDGSVSAAMRPERRFRTASELAEFWQRGDVLDHVSGRPLDSTIETKMLSFHIDFYLDRYRKEHVGSLITRKSTRTVDKGADKAGGTSRPISVASNGSDDVVVISSSQTGKPAATATIEEGDGEAQTVSALNSQSRTASKFWLRVLELRPDFSDVVVYFSPSGTKSVRCVVNAGGTISPICAPNYRFNSAVRFADALKSGRIELPKGFAISKYRASALYSFSQDFFLEPGREEEHRVRDSFSPADSKQLYAMEREQERSRRLIPIDGLNLHRPVVVDLEAAPPSSEPAALEPTTASSLEPTAPTSLETTPPTSMETTPPSSMELTASALEEPTAASAGNTNDENQVNDEVEEDPGFDLAEFWDIAVKVKPELVGKIVYFVPAPQEVAPCIISADGTFSPIFDRLKRYKEASEFVADLICGNISLRVGTCRISPRNLPKEPHEYTCVNDFYVDSQRNQSILQYLGKFRHCAGIERPKEAMGQRAITVRSNYCTRAVVGDKRRCHPCEKASQAHEAFARIPRQDLPDRLPLAPSRPSMQKTPAILPPRTTTMQTKRPAPPPASSTAIKIIRVQPSAIKTARIQPPAITMDNSIDTDHGIYVSPPMDTLPVPANRQSTPIAEQGKRQGTYAGRPPMINFPNFPIAAPRRSSPTPEERKRKATIQRAQKTAANALAKLARLETELEKYKPKHMINQFAVRALVGHLNRETSKVYEPKCNWTEGNASTRDDDGGACGYAAQSIGSLCAHIAQEHHQPQSTSAHNVRNFEDQKYYCRWSACANRAYPYKSAHHLHLHSFQHTGSRLSEQRLLTLRGHLENFGRTANGRRYTEQMRQAILHDGGSTTTRSEWDVTRAKSCFHLPPYRGLIQMRKPKLAPPKTKDPEEVRRQSARMDDVFGGMFGRERMQNDGGSGLYSMGNRQRRGNLGGTGGDQDDDQGHPDLWDEEEEPVSATDDDAEDTNGEADAGVDEDMDEGDGAIDFEMDEEEDF